MHAERGLSRAASQFDIYAEAAVSFESGMGPKPNLRRIAPATILPRRAEADAMLSETAAGHNGCLSTVYKLPRPLRTLAAKCICIRILLILRESSIIGERAARTECISQHAVCLSEA